MSVNKIILIGHVGKDPEPMAQGVRFPIATNEKWKDKSGELRERTDWHNCLSFGNQSDVVLKHVKKGDKLYVEGKQRNEKYTKDDGTEGFSSAVFVERFSFEGSRADVARNEPAAAPVEDKSFSNEEIPF